MSGGHGDMCGWDKNEGQEIFRFWRGNGRDLNAFWGAWPRLGDGSDCNGS